MKATGIIAEYDPFHNGHLYHIKKAREITGADTVVAVMSGPFMQRGLPALFSKTERAAMAVEAGADLVIELPFIYACNSSAEFAGGGIGILNGLGCIDSFVFGAETNDAALLEAAAHASAAESLEMKSAVRSFLDKGLSYPEAVTRAAGMVYGAEYESVLRSPNNLLGIEYLKAASNQGTSLKGIPVKRMAAAHNEAADENAGPIASGTAVRSILINEGAAAAAGRVPHSTLEIIQQRGTQPAGARTGAAGSGRVPGAPSATAAHPAPGEPTRALAAGDYCGTPAEAEITAGEPTRAHAAGDYCGTPVEAEITAGEPTRPLAAADSAPAPATSSPVPPYEASEAAETAAASFADEHAHTVRKMCELVRYRILTSSPQELASVYSVNEGLENRIKKAALTASTLDELAEEIKTRRYTRARINRSLAHILVNLSEDDFKELKGTYYARILAFSGTGARLLRTIKKTASIPVISRTGRADAYDEKVARCLEYDMRASDIYEMLHINGAEPGSDRKTVPYIKTIDR